MENRAGAEASIAPMMAPEDTAYPNLFSPITLAGRTLRNRIVHASMTTRYQKDGCVTDKLIAYHVNRAKGGASLSVTEPLSVLSRQIGAGRVEVLSERDRAGLARWAKAVDAQGCGLIGQLQDPGRGRHQDMRIPKQISASALPDELSWTVGHPMTTGEVETVIREFARSAYLLWQAGFAGVELSAGHGHLFHQFLSPVANHRTDRFGGDLAGRARLLTELLLQIRQDCGPNFIVGVKLPGEDGIQGGIDMEAAKAITQVVHETSVPDYITYCWGAHSDTLDWHLPDVHGKRTPYVGKIAELGQAAPGRAIGALGLITDPNEGEHLVSEGLADLVMVGRALITDPAWPIKAQAGRESEIRYCVSCNTCWQVITTHGILQCDNNPRVGAPDEADWTPPRLNANAAQTTEIDVQPAETPKRVVVVGAGVAGLEAAWLLAARGHRVIQFGRSDEVGGKAKLQADLPGGEGISSVYDYQKLAADRWGVTFRLGEEADTASILACQPDVVIMATGATPSWPDYLPKIYEGEGFFPDLREAVAELARFQNKQAGTAFVYDQDHTAFTYAATEFLTQKFDRVVLATPAERLGNQEALVNRQGIYRRLYALGVEIFTLHQPSADSAFEEGEVTLEHVFTGAKTQISDVAFHSYSTPRRPNDQLVASLEASGVHVIPIGDAYAPRFLLNATQEGYAAGMSI